jgi:hypothetical protein
METHDVYRQVGYIQQALSQNRKPIGIFLGAGCPLSIIIKQLDESGSGIENSHPLIPDVHGLTKIVTNKLKSTGEEPSKSDKLLAQIIADGIAAPTIEDILSQLRALRQVAGKGTVREFIASELDELDKEICKIICAEVNIDLPNEESPYHDLAVWARSIPRVKPVHIFTTNYDLLIEQALEESACPYFDGFIGSKKAFFDLGTVENEDLLHPRWCRLWKIHGSINWILDKEKKVVRSDKISENESYLIYPSHLKYDQSRKMPYIAMLDRLKDFILSPSAILFISGFSFSDDHINDVIVQALRSNPSAMCFAFLYGNLGEEKYEKARQCAKQISNLSLLAFDKGFVGRQEGNWTLTNDDLVSEIPGQVITKKSTQDPENASIEVVSYELNIGNFAKFGEFLKEMSFDQNQDDKKDER